MPVGWTEGCLVGVPVGFKEMLGTGVGSPAPNVGSTDGAKVGFAEGVFVGCGVGEFLE